jgi:hypothetical protein
MAMAMANRSTIWAMTYRSEMETYIYIIALGIGLVLLLWVVEGGDRW